MATSKNISIQSHHLFQLVCGCEDLGSASISNFRARAEKQNCLFLPSTLTPVQPVTPGKQGCSSEWRRMCLLQIYCVFGKPQDMNYHIVFSGLEFLHMEICRCSSNSSFWTSVWGGFSYFIHIHCEIKINFTFGACASARSLTLLHGCIPYSPISKVPLSKIPVIKF